MEKYILDRHEKWLKGEKRKRRFIYGLYGFYGKDVCVLFPGSAYRIRVSTLPK